MASALLFSIAAGLAAGTGGKFVVLPFAAAGAAALIPIMESVKPWALPVWLAAGPVLYPFVRFPGGKSALITFDRVWLLGLALVSFSAVTDLSGASKRTRSLVRWACLLGLVIFVRCLLGPLGLGPIKICIDAFVIPILVFMLVRAASVDSESINRLLFSLGLGGAVAAAIGVAERVAGFSLASMAGGELRFDHDVGVVRYSGPFDVPEVFVCMLLSAMAATVCWRLRRGRIVNSTALVMVALQFSGIFFAYFRTGMAAAILILVGAVALRRANSVRSLITLLAMGAVAYLVVIGLTQINTVFASRVSNTNNYYARVGAYTQGLKIIESAPLKGVGITRFDETAERLAPVIEGGRVNVVNPHNSFIQIAAEAGVFALAVFIGVLIAAIRLCWNVWRRSTTFDDEALGLCAGLAIVAYFVMSSTLAMVWYGVPTACLFALLGMNAATSDRLAIRT